MGVCCGQSGADNAQVRGLNQKLPPFEVTIKGKKKDRDLDKIWEEYAAACIAHFKFIDKAEIIQEDYKEYKTKKKNTKIDKNVIKNSNEFMLNKKSPPAPRITDHINVKSTKIKTAKKMIIPQQRNINIKTDKFKNKI